ncbi:MAG: lipid-A-disaccharide synthase [Chromatiales bacterium]|nr:lipid-A-disaccharide synthase [Chromatiales bacterium]
MRIGIVAGEASGDALGADLIAQVRKRHPTATIEGIGGPKMQAQGCRSLYPMERLSLIGLVEVLRHLPALLRMRADLKRHFVENPPDIFIGVDAPDFNLRLERGLKEHGIPVVHYVSPMVWAWRSYRTRRIARSIDLLLTLFPFEARFFEKHQVPVEFVGHPLFDAIPPECPQGPARLALGFSADDQVIALLPGSRNGELHRLGELFLDTAAWLAEQRPGLRFLSALTSQGHADWMRERIAARDNLPPIDLIVGRSKEVMQASDVVLMASGTAALEAMVLKRPMVVAYRLAPLTYFLMKRMVKVKVFSPPNLLLDTPLVPELIQDQARTESLGAEVLDLLENQQRRQNMVNAFDRLHRQLRMGASARAAQAVLGLLESRR